MRTTSWGDVFLKKIKEKKGFTLIEILVVIAIIAVLVAIIMPIIQTSQVKSRAAADAANLRSTLGQANALLMLNNADENILTSSQITAGECKTFTDADMQIMYVNPGFIKIYYVDGDNYYSLNYFSTVAGNGSVEESASHILTKTQAEAGYSSITWYDITTHSKITD